MGVCPGGGQGVVVNLVLQQAECIGRSHITDENLGLSKHGESGEWCIYEPASSFFLPSSRILNWSFDAVYRKGGKWHNRGTNDAV